MPQRIDRLILISVAFLGLMPVSAYAQTSIVVKTEQRATVSGNNNQVYQTINQTIINRPGRGWVNRDKDKDKQKNDRSARARDDRNGRNDGD